VTIIDYSSSRALTFMLLFLDEFCDCCLQNADVAVERLSVCSLIGGTERAYPFSNPPSALANNAMGKV
jgi:hypothetical protein